MQINLKFIKGGVLDGDLSVLGKFALPSLLTENDSNTALFVTSDNSVKKRLLGSLAFKSATDFYTRNEVDNTFLKKTGGTMTGDLLVDNSRIRFGEAGSNTITRDDAGAWGAGVSSGFYQALGKVNYPTTSAGWWHLLDVRHSNPTNNFAMQMAGAFDDQRFFLRKTANLATQAWSEILTMDTDGVLNAEKLVIKTAYRPDKNRAGLTFIGVSGITGASNWALRGVYQYSAGVNSNSVGGDLDLIKALNGNTILGTKTDGTALGFVGIGTESPLSRFHVAAATSSVLFTGLGGTNGSIKFDGSGSKGAAIKFNTEGAYIANEGGGNELINYSSPQSHVFLSGGSEVGRFSQSGFSTGGWSITGADLVVRILSRGTGGRAIVHDSNNRLALNYANDFAETSIGSNILFRNGASSYILNSNFGIGTATPNSRFVVNGGTLSTDYVSSEARIGDGAIHLQKTVTGGIFEAVRAMNMDATAGTTVRLVAAMSSQPFVNESQGKGFLDFIRFSQNGDVDFSLSLANTITGPVERLRVKGSNGYVGIGTATPSEALEVVGNIKLGLRNYLYTTSNDLNPVIKTSRSDGTMVGTLSTNGWGDFQFSKGLSVGYADAFTGFSGLLVNGAVGIGTKTPSEQLHVSKSATGSRTNILIENDNAGWGAGILFKNTYGSDVTQSEITYDYFGSAYGTSSPNSHGFNFVSGRGGMSNFFFRKADKSILVKFTNSGDVDIVGNYYQNGVLLNNFSGKYADLTGTPDMGAVWGAINGKANTAHRHNFSDLDGFFLGNKTQLETGRNKFGGDIYTYNVYEGLTTNKPAGLQYGNVLTWGGGVGASATQLISGWSSHDQNFIAFRSLRDTIDDWYSWKRIYHEGYKPLVADIGGLNDSLNAIWQDIHNKANSNHTHDYNSLTNRPDLSAYLTWGNVVSDNANVNTTNGNPIATKLVSIYVNDLWGAVNSKANANHTHNWESITGKPTFFDGNYNSLSNRPDLSAYLTWGNVVSDNANVNATNGNPIATKLVSIYVNDLWGAVNSKANVNHTHDYYSISNRPVLFSGNYNDLSNKPDLSGYITGVPFSGRSSIPTAGLQVSQHISFTGEIRTGSLFITNNVVAEKKLYVQDNINCTAGVYGESLHSTHGLTLQNPSKLLDTDVNLSNVTGIYVEGLAGVVTKLTLNQFINLLEQL